MNNVLTRISTSTIRRLAAEGHPGAYIDSQTGEMWRVSVHMGEHPRQIMEPGIVRATITGDALLPYLPHLVMRPL